MSGDGWVKSGDVVLMTEQQGPMSELFEVMILAVNPEDNHHVATIDHRLIGDDNCRLELGSPIRALHRSYGGFGDVPEGVHAGRVITRFDPVPSASVVHHWIKAACQSTGFPLPSSLLIIPVLGGESLVVTLPTVLPQHRFQGFCVTGPSCSSGDGRGSAAAAVEVEGSPEAKPTDIDMLPVPQPEDVVVEGAETPPSGAVSDSLGEGDVSEAANGEEPSASSGLNPDALPFVPSSGAAAHPDSSSG
jgi:hypothetical protein